jgi:hypothetical protein
MLGHALKSLLVKLCYLEKVSKKSTEEFSGRNSKYYRSFPKEIIKLVTLSMSKLQAAQVVP